MPTYTLANTPRVVPINSFIFPIINVSSPTFISSISCFVDITAPNEGSGPDPTLMYVELAAPDAISVVLHSNENLALNGINYDDDRIPFDGSLSQITGTQGQGDWAVLFTNSSLISTAIVNEFSFDLNGATAAAVDLGRALKPTTPAAKVVPGNIQYSFGVGQPKNTKVTFSFPITAYQTSIMDTTRRIPFNASIEDISFSAVNGGSNQNTKLSLYKVSGGVVTKLIDQDILLEAGTTFRRVKYGARYEKAVNSGDTIFISLDQVGTNVSGIVVGLTLKASN